MECFTSTRKSGPRRFKLTIAVGELEIVGRP